MNTSKRLYAALKAPDLVRTFRRVVLELAAEGCATREIAALLEKLLLEMRERPDHHDDGEDAVLGGGGAVVGGKVRKQKE
jgi:hypothetical protein